MHTRNYRCAAALAALLLVGRAAAAAQDAKDLRRNATVRAVQKVKSSVVAVKVTQKLGGGRTKDAVGTGLIVDERGYLVTNCHVVAGNNRVTVRLVDGTNLPGDVIYS